jgi:ubiquinone/menaquinone biosynthesis C-methylase UbiE
MVANAETLTMIKDHSLDFVIACHLLEHIPDPIAAIAEWLRVLKDGGILYLAVPNRCCNEYDFQRTSVALDHVIKDFEVKDRDKKEEHWHEFVRVVEGIRPEDPQFEPVLRQEYRAKDSRIHMHTFDAALLEGILSYIKEQICNGLQVLKRFRYRYSFEIIVILRKNRSP